MTKNPQQAETIAVDLATLMTRGFTKLTPSMCACMAECASVCLRHIGHGDDIHLDLCGTFEKVAMIRPIQVDDEMSRTFDDLEEATEYGACGIACVLIQQLTPFTVIKRARKKTGFDYYLSDSQTDLMQQKARMEVSGLLKRTERDFTRRIREKLTQTEVSDDMNIPAWIIVVHFLKPKAHMEERKVTNHAPATN